MQATKYFNNGKFTEDIRYRRLIQNRHTLFRAASEIGISKATLCRLEHGGDPDIETFIRVCVWLGFFPERYFNEFFPKPVTADAD